MDSDYSYSKERQLKLFIKRKKFHKLNNIIYEKKFLNDAEFLKSLENTRIEDSVELQTYSTMVISHLRWENRNHYYQLIEKLLSGPMLFLELRKRHEFMNDAAEKLQADLVDELVMLFDRYCPDPEIRETNEFQERELKNIISQIYMEIKNNYP